MRMDVMVHLSGTWLSVCNRVVEGWRRARGLWSTERAAKVAAFMAQEPSAAAWDAFVAPYWQAAQQAEHHARDRQAGCILLKSGQLRGALQEEALAWVHALVAAAHTQHTARLAAAGSDALPELLHAAMYAAIERFTCTPLHIQHRVCMRYCDGAPRLLQQAADDLAAVERRVITQQLLSHHDDDHN